MTDYWITFRIASGPGYNDRYQPMLEAMARFRKISWGEPTSFWAVRADTSLETFTRILMKSLDPRRDLLVVGEMGKAKIVCYFGQLEHPDVFNSMFPFAKKLG